MAAVAGSDPMRIPVPGKRDDVKPVLCTYHSAKAAENHISPEAYKLIMQK